MKTTESFNTAIQAHLDQVAAKDPSFAKKLKDPKKNLDDCITYILNQVQKSGCNGFKDSEIYGMAIHYYDEANIKPGAPVKARVVVNQSVELSSDEIETIRKIAKEQLIVEEREKLRKKPAKAKKTETSVSPTLFD